MGDFNGDADLDLAVANGAAPLTEGVVNVLLGAAGGGFGPRTTFDVGETPRSIAVGDFNGDADPDLAVANLDSDTVSVLLGQPGGSFGPQTTFATAARPAAVATGDFNGDGDLDMAIAESGHSRVAVRLGGPGGSFGARTAFLVGLSPDSIVVGDFNGDSDPDLAVANRGSELHAGVVSVLLGGAGGTFGAETRFPIEEQPGFLASGDFNGDGDPDLAAANFRANSLSVLLGQPGGGGFGGQTIFPTGEGPGGVAVGDFNSDGDPDLAVANAFSNTVGVRLGGPGGSFGPSVTYPTRQDPAAVAVGDFDRDGDADLAVLAGFRFVSMFLNTGAWEASLDPTSVPFPPTPAGDESKERTVVLTNIGATDLSVSEVAIAGADAGGFVISDDTCSGATLAPADTCSVGTRFRPGRVGSHSASLRFTDTAGDSPQSVALTGTGTTPVTLSPSSIRFERRPDSTSSAYHTVTLTNHLGKDLTVDAVTLTAADASSFRLPARYDECSGTAVAAGGTCEVKVLFRPDGVGPKSANLVFLNDAVSSPQIVGLSGTGTPGPWLTLSRQGLRFGHVQVGATSATKTVTLTNTGSAPMTISSITLGGNDPGDYVGLSETCTGLSSLGPDESCSASIAFQPSATGERHASLTIDSTAPRSPRHVELSGTGT